MKLTAKRQEFLDHASSKYGAGAEITKVDVDTLMSEMNIKHPYWFTDNFRVGRSLYKLPSETELESETPEVPVEVLASESTEIVPDTVTNLMMSTDIEKMVPEKFEGFVSWGYFKEIKSIIRSRMFYPIFVTGLSGNGKTLNVQEACAELKRECVRVNVTIETDEDDLIGVFVWLMEKPSLTWGQLRLRWNVVRFFF